MKRLVLTSLFIFSVFLVNAQTAKDLFISSDVKITWLGIDFSNVKLVGEFTQFFNAGEQSASEIRDEYFERWNTIIMAEPDKYDLKKMLRKDDIAIEIEMIMALNFKTPLEGLESYSAPSYSENDIREFIKAYDTSGKEGIGILFLAECLNKNAKEGIFHFIALDMNSNEILIQKRLSGKPGGFGLRNYWAGSIHEVIIDITKKQYKKWKAEYL